MNDSQEQVYVLKAFRNDLERINHDLKNSTSFYVDDYVDEIMNYGQLYWDISSVPLVIARGLRNVTNRHSNGFNFDYLRKCLDGMTKKIDENLNHLEHVASKGK